MNCPIPVGFSSASLAGYGLNDVLVRGHRLGFSSIEILGFEGERHSQGDLCGFAFAERPPDALEELRSGLADYTTISVHAPFIFVPLLTANPGIAREAFRQVTACIRGIAAVGGTGVTIHLNSVPFRTPEEWRMDAEDILRRLGDEACERGVRIGLETGFPNEEEIYCSLIENLDHPGVGACIDTGHIFHYYPHQLRGTEEGVVRHNDILNRIVARLGRKIVVFHVHDNRAEDFRDHRAPGRGIIDWQRLLETMTKAACHAPLLLELEEADLEDALLEGKQLLVDRMKRLAVPE